MALKDWTASLLRRTADVFQPQPDGPLSVTRAMEKRHYTPTKSDYLSSFGGMIENPDEVISTMGVTWEGLAFYERMLRQFSTLYAACQQRIDRVPERRIVAGDPSSETSTAMARDAQRLWQLLPNREIIQRKLLMGMFMGFAPVEKVYGRDATTGLLGPISLYDQPARNFKFDEEGNAYFLGRLSLAQGELVKPHQMMFFRWGSSWTPYGDGELKYVYVATWMIQTIMDFGLQALEELGRPIPMYRVPSTMGSDERGELEQSVASRHKYYVIVPSSGPEVTVEFPGLNVAAGGAAGRAEFEAIRYLDGWIQRAILGTQQTQDRAGGSRALEEVRTSIVDDKTRQASDTLDICLTSQWLSDFGALNWPDQPRELWPRFDSEPTPGEDLGPMHSRVMEAVDRKIPVSAAWYYKTFRILPGEGDDVLGAAADDEENDGSEAQQ